MAAAPDRGQSFVVADCELWVTDRSLADLGRPVDVLVSSDDNYLSHGGGVSRALWVAGGEALIGADVSGDSSTRVLGDVVVTGAGRLNAKAIFHAITIDFDHNRRLTASQLSDVIARIFTLAADRGHESIGLPLIAWLCHSSRPAPAELRRRYQRPFWLAGPRTISPPPQPFDKSWLPLLGTDSRSRRRLLVHCARGIDRLATFVSWPTPCWSAQTGCLPDETLDRLTYGARYRGRSRVALLASRCSWTITSRAWEADLPISSWRPTSSC